MPNVTELILSEDDVDLEGPETPPTLSPIPPRPGLRPWLPSCTLADDGWAIVDDLPRPTVLVAPTFILGTPELGFSEEVSERVSYATVFDVPARSLGRCSRGGRSRFLIRVDHVECTVTVTVRIALRMASTVLGLEDLPPPLIFADPLVLLVPEDKRDAWRNEIVSAWSRQVRLVREEGRASCEAYDVVVDVEWLSVLDLLDDSIPEPHRTVFVHGGEDRANTENWYLDDPNVVAAHEFGHYLGNPDEYDGTCDGCPDRPIRSPSIMNNQYEHPWGSPRHFWMIQQWLERVTCSRFRAEATEDRARVLGGGLTFGDVGQAAEDAYCNLREENHPLLWRLGLRRRRDRYE